MHNERFEAQGTFYRSNGFGIVMVRLLKKKKASGDFPKSLALSTSCSNQVTNWPYVPFKQLSKEAAPDSLSTWAYMTIQKRGSS